MKRFWLFGFALALILPAYWTAEKGLQKLAVSSVARDVRREISTPGFLVEKFDLKKPLRRVYRVFNGESAQDNDVRDIIEAFRDEAPENTTVALKINNRHGRDLWYLYTLEGCGEHFCPYDINKLTPIPEIPIEDATEVYLRDSEVRDAYGFHLLITYDWSKTPSNAFMDASVSVADEATNPFDRAVREMENDRPPNYWSTKWTMTIDHEFLDQVER